MKQVKLAKMKQVKLTVPSIREVLMYIFLFEGLLFIIYGNSVLGLRASIESVLRWFGYLGVLYYALLIAGRFIERTINIGEEKLLKKRKRREINVRKRR